MLQRNPHITEFKYLEPNTDGLDLAAKPDVTFGRTIDAAVVLAEFGCYINGDTADFSSVPGAVVDNPRERQIAETAASDRTEALCQLANAAIYSVLEQQK